MGFFEGLGEFGGVPTGRAQTEVVCQVMRKKVIPFPSREAAGAPPVAQGRSRIVVHMGAQRYAMDITCVASVLPPETASAETAGRLERRQVQTRFLHLSEPAGLGDRIDGWRVCWVGGWDQGKVFFVVMAERVVRATQP